MRGVGIGDLSLEGNRWWRGTEKEGLYHLGAPSRLLEEAAGNAEGGKRRDIRKGSGKTKVTDGAVESPLWKLGFQSVLEIYNNNETNERLPRI